MTARLRAPAALLAIATSTLAGCQDSNGACPGNRSACAVFFESAEDCGEVQRIDFEITQDARAGIASACWSSTDPTPAGDGRRRT